MCGIGVVLSMSIVDYAAFKLHIFTFCFASKENGG